MCWWGVAVRLEAGSGAADGAVGGAPGTGSAADTGYGTADTADDGGGGNPVVVDVDVVAVAVDGVAGGAAGAFP